MENRIVLDSKILNGKPIIKGTRISVEFILELLSSGLTVQQILKEYPSLVKEDVLAALNYATIMLKHEEVYPTVNIA